MNIDKIKSPFQFINSGVVKFSMENSLISTKEKTINIDCDMDYEVIDCTEVKKGFLGVLHFLVNLTGKVEDNDTFKINLIMKGNFAGLKESLTIDNFKEMLEVNGTATLSQITRAYLTSVTSLSGMVPINLPMVNIYALKKHKESKGD